MAFWQAKHIVGRTWQSSFALLYGDEYGSLHWATAIPTSTSVSMTAFDAAVWISVWNLPARASFACSGMNVGPMVARSKTCCWAVVTAFAAKMWTGRSGAGKQRSCGHRRPRPLRFEEHPLGRSSPSFAAVADHTAVRWKLAMY